MKLSTGNETGGRKEKNLRIFSFGEILFDVFADGAHLGGAPLNLAVHLHRLGAEVGLISAVGEDELGETARREVARQGLSLAYIARVPQPTGTVTVTLDEAKVPSYFFQLDCAYDHIPVPELADPAMDLFCFGTLAQRGEVSRASLWKLLDQVAAPVFCDVNLRQNFYSKAVLEASLQVADIVKLNDEELPRIASMFGMAPECEALADRFQLQLIVETLGPDGCRIWQDGRTVDSPAYPAEIVSTVGAGDAFSAAFLYHFLSGCGIEAAAAAGNRLAAEVAARPGAF